MAGPEQRGNRKQPKISVGMPVYNGEPYLASAIQSVLDQTCGDFELIISDNASTDGTEAICREFAAKDARILYIRNSGNIGAANNYNQLFHRSRGEYFRWFNADDLSSNRLHEACLQVLEANPDAVMAYGKTDIIDGEGHLIEHYADNLDLRQDSAAERFFRYFQVVGLTNAIYGLIRRSALAKTILMGNGSFPAADINLMAELALQGKIIEIPETLFLRRMHEQASSWDRKNQTVQQVFWTGKSSKFVLPTLKKEWAYWRAISNCPAPPTEKIRMKKFLARRMIWSRRTILQESAQALSGLLLKRSRA